MRGLFRLLGRVCGVSSVPVGRIPARELRHAHLGWQVLLADGDRGVLRRVTLDEDLAITIGLRGTENWRPVEVWSRPVAADTLLTVRPLT